MSTSGSKRVLACIRCSEKRIKCDRTAPCATCIKQNANCEYRSRKTRVTRNVPRQTPEGRLVDLSITSIPENQNHALDNKPVAGLEVPFGVAALDSQNNDVDFSGPQLTVFKPQLLQGQEGTKLVDNSLWSRIVEEIPREEGSAGEESTKSTKSADSTEFGDYSYVLGCVSSSRNAEHPSAAGISILWHTFTKNVDPLVKVIHVPSFQTAIEKAVGNLDRIPKSFEAFMFSMYSMAVFSMSDEECMKSFKESRKVLLAYYVGATKIALLRARFMSSTSLVVLQALTLHIFSIRQDDEPRAVWSLTGLALRIAQAMGLSIDGSLLGLSPFETEIRRRIWWQLKLHDSRAAELCGQAKFQQFDMDGRTPRLPANVNDADLTTSMAHAPAVSPRPTEMIWTLMRAELANFASAHKRHIKSSKTMNSAALSSEEYSAFDNIRGKDSISEEIEELMETKYLRFCDPSKPLEMLTLIGTRYATDFIRFIAHHPRRWAQQADVPPEEKHLVWNLSLQILDRSMMMQSMSRLRQFSWIVPYNLQWPVIIHILDTLRIEPNHHDAEKAWNLINTLYDLNTELLLNTRRPIYIAVSSLCLKAHQARANVTGLANLNNEQVPNYIAELQLRCQKARNKNYSCHKAGNNEPIQFSKAPSSPITKSSAPAVPFETLPILDEDSFWFEIDHASSKMDTAIDASYLPHGNNWFDTHNDSAIDWTQWDTWMGISKPSST